MVAGRAADTGCRGSPPVDGDTAAGTVRQPMNDWNAGIIDEFRRNGGKVGGGFEARTLLLLHTTGAKSGAERVTPLAYQRVGDGFAVFGSKAGAPTHPAWYHNLLANPRTKIEVGSETIDVVARDTEGAERDAIWERQKRDWPGFAEYEERTSRTIPVVLLEPV
jgi:deazaflavin-dependent oxidoreductase (nitroreductase family)